MVGFIVLEDSPAIGKRVIAYVGRLPSPNSSVHLQVSSLVITQSIERYISDLGRWLIPGREVATHRWSRWQCPQSQTCTPFLIDNHFYHFVKMRSDVNILSRPTDCVTIKIPLEAADIGWASERLNISLTSAFSHMKRSDTWRADHFSITFALIWYHRAMWNGRNENKNI